MIYTIASCLVATIVVALLVYLPTRASAWLLAVIMIIIVKVAVIDPIAAPWLKLHHHHISSPPREEVRT